MPENNRVHFLKYLFIWLSQVSLWHMGVFMAVCESLAKSRVPCHLHQPLGHPYISSWHGQLGGGASKGWVGKGSDKVLANLSPRSLRVSEFQILWFFQFYPLQHLLSMCKTAPTGCVGCLCVAQNYTEKHCFFGLSVLLQSQYKCFLIRLLLATCSYLNVFKNKLYNALPPLSH